MYAARSGSTQSPGHAGAFAYAADVVNDGDAISLVHPLPPLAPHTPDRPSTREQLARLEAVAHQELAELKRLLDARPAATRPADELLGMAWDLGLDGDALK
ncbi:MAG: hypothetical protein GAK31_00433 [Stenotrophomonas maltophilia]|uniref:Uncharacterized protein n=1 Tax=Stenotrophomonas maltophilia TaxID=40324 RepID=A0A7V8JN74_STEMA|nr:MAG: hypothetical protein GAK31_00433 [Stenotrophomonas maltophilia]